MKTNTFITLSTATANIGVLVGLVFLIFEIKQNSAIALSQIRQERSLSGIAEYSSYAQDQAFSRLIGSGLRNAEFDSISPDEWHQVYNLELARMTRIEDVFFQYQEGLIDESVYRFSMAMAAGKMPMWKWLKIVSVNPDFTAAVDAFMDAPEYEPSQSSTIFKEWAKSNESPMRGLGVPRFFQ